MTYPKVAIIILNYTNWQDTIECLESVLRNDYPNYQVIVVDNGSPNNSMEYIKAWTEGRQEVLTPKPGHPLYDLSHPPVKKPIPYIYYTREEAEKGGDFELEEKLTKEWQEQRKSNNKELIPTSPYPLIFIQTGENIGFAGGNNIGIRYILRKVDCEYVLLLNNDTAVEKDFLSELVKTAESDSRLGIVGGKIFYYYKPDKIWYAGGELDLIRGSGYHFQRESKKQEFEVTFITGCLMLFKKSTIQKVGLLPEEYFLVGEDADYCYQYLKAGFKLKVNNKSKIYHKISPTLGGGGSPIEAYYNTRNRLYFITRKVKNFLYVIVFLIFFIPSRIIKILQFVFNWQIGKIKFLIRGFLDGLKGNMGKLR